MKIRSFIIFVIFLYVFNIGEAGNQKTSERIVFVKFSESVEMINYPEVYNSSLDVVCSLYPLMGLYDLCKNKGWKGYYITTPMKMAKNLLVIELPEISQDIYSDFASNFAINDEKADEIYTTHDSKEIDLMYVGEENRNLIYDQPIVVINTDTLMSKYSEKKAEIISTYNAKEIEKESLREISKRPYLMASFIIKNIDKIKENLVIKTKNPNIIYYAPNKDILSMKNLNELKQFSNLSSSNISVIFRMKNYLSEDDMLNRVVKSYTDQVCRVKNYKISCDLDISIEQSVNLCQLKKLSLLENIQNFCKESDALREVYLQQRSAILNPHNLYTRAEYTSNYAFVFNICAGSFAFLIIAFIVIITLMMEIDASAFSILNKDAPQKLKTE